MNKIVIVQVLIFILGVILMITDGSGGYIKDMTWLSYTGVILCILGIGFTYIKGGIQLLIEKIKKS